MWVNYTNWNDPDLFGKLFCKGKALEVFKSLCVRACVCVCVWAQEVVGVFVCIYVIWHQMLVPVPLTRGHRQGSL